MVKIAYLSIYQTNTHTHTPHTPPHTNKQIMSLPQKFTVQKGYVLLCWYINLYSNIVYNTSKNACEKERAHISRGQEVSPRARFDAGLDTH